MYTKEKWVEFHGINVPPEQHDAEYEKWLAWRLSVDRGETRSQVTVIYRGEIGYESPITGQAITSMAQRREDMARADCVEYDPEMRTDYNRRCEEQSATLEKSMEETTNKLIAQMPSKKREALAVELEHGAEAETVRITPGQQSV